MQSVLAALEQRWEAMFMALAAGEDVAPAARLRTEGIMEAVVLLSLATPQALDSVMADCYQKAFKCDFVDTFGDDWRLFYEFPQIPAIGTRAPVVPSTPD